MSKSTWIIIGSLFLLTLSGCIQTLRNGFGIDLRTKAMDSNITVYDYAQLISNKRSNKEKMGEWVSQCEFVVDVDCKFGCDSGSGYGYKDFQPENSIVDDFKYYCTEAKKGTFKVSGKKYLCDNEDGSQMFSFWYDKYERVRDRMPSLNNSLHVYGTIKIHVDKENPCGTKE